ncbi:alanine dehydrogenase [Deferrisoma camini]|uniref:alanine dehydrogenase n=1 Tax=Deferrisoma camini TaxID=1035120 RepID=UPI00046CAA43|nr:alanine dehydrogenase [Deferrisoma camini]
MIVGIPKERKNNEYRVGIVPSGVEELTRDGHTVLIETGAGLGSGISDDEFVSAGARIASSAREVWEAADLVMKVKEPLPEEYDLLQEGQILFTFLHLAPLPELGRVLLERRIRAVAYETIQLGDGSLPLLAPMSQVAGKMAVQLGAAFLQRERGGMGILLGGVPGTKHGRIVIIGGGAVGINAAKVAYGLGAEVVIIDINHARLSYIDDVFDGKVVTLMSNRRNVREAAASCDMLVGAVLVPGAKAPRLVDREILRGMKPGSVFVDVAIDQGGVSETSRPTSHSDPVYEEEGVIHYCVPNIPGSVPMTSTYALTNVTLPYCRKLASGVEEALRADPSLAKGVNTWDGHVTCRPVAEAFGMEWTPLERLLG